jgi:hypothetical protein
VKSAKWFLFVIILLAAGLCPAASTFVAKLDPVPPFPAVCAAANAAGIPLTGIDSTTAGGGLAPGDSETGLITLHEKNHRLTQWLISFEATTNRPAPSAKARHSMVLYTSTGNRYEFPRSPVGIQVRILGPFPEPDPRRRKSAAPGDEKALVFVNQNFLSLGLDGGAAAIHRWGQAAQAEGATNFVDSFDAADKPYYSIRTNHDAALAVHWHVTPAEERAVVCWDPALDAYFDIVGETPNLDHILLKVVSLPSIWSVFKNVGVKVDFGFDNDYVGPLALTNWGLPGGATVYSLPSLLTINQHHSLAVTMLVTAPHPPLLVCGGVLGFLAENPEVEENYLTLRMIGAHGHP